MSLVLSGGTSIKYYFEKVAKHHGLEFVSTEYLGAELPGSHGESTFYVTHLRDPVSNNGIANVSVPIMVAESSKSTRPLMMNEIKKSTRLQGH
jgi:hypothetical protein